MKKPVGASVKLLLTALPMVLEAVLLRKSRVFIAQKGGDIVANTMTVLLTALVAILSLVVLYWLVSAMFRAIGRDPDACYRLYNNRCKERFGNAGGIIKLERPVFTSDWVKKISTACVIFLAAMAAFTLVAVNAEYSFLGFVLSTLSIFGVLLVYFLLWLISKILRKPRMRLRKIGKRGCTNG